MKLVFRIKAANYLMRSRTTYKSSCYSCSVGHATPPLNFRDLPFSVVRTCPVKFQNRNRGIEFCRSRKIINLVFIQGQVRLRHFLGRVLRLGQERGPSAAARCLTFKTPPVTSLYAVIPQILFFWIYKMQSPSLFGILRGMCAQQKMANA